MENDKILNENLLDDESLQDVNGGTNAKIASNLLYSGKTNKCKTKKINSLYSGETNRKAGNLLDKDDKFKEFTEKGTWC